MTLIGLLGAGYMGTIHAHIYSRLPGVDGILVYARQPEQARSLAAAVGGRPCQNSEEIFENASVELVDISLPTSYHRQFAVQALGSGKHVVCEKPLALTLEDVDLILDAYRRSGKYLMVGHVLRFSPAFQSARRLLEEGSLGEPLFATTRRLSASPVWASWFRDPAMSGGAVLDLMVHDLDLLHWYFGLPRSVYARGVRDEGGSWNYVNALFTFAGGFSAAVEASNMMPAGFPFIAGLRILCQHGAIELQTRINGGKVDDEVSEQIAYVHTPGRPNQPIPHLDDDPFQKELAYFLECVAEHRQPELITPLDARNAVKAAIAVRRSLDEGMEIDLGGEP